MHGKFLQHPVIYTTTLSPSLTIIDLYLSNNFQCFPGNKQIKLCRHLSVSPSPASAPRLSTPSLSCPPLLPNVLIYYPARTQWAVEWGNDIDREIMAVVLSTKLPADTITRDNCSYYAVRPPPFLLAFKLYCYKYSAEWSQFPA